MKKRFALFATIIISLFACQTLFAQINLISPVKGTWANKQILVIDNTQQGDYFYSINGSDPERFGFAYDGPVLLDMTGDITLRVSYVGHNGKKESASVDFTVKENDAYTAPYGVFISSFYDSGLLNYSAGSVITIPSNLYYSLGLPPDSFIPGQDLFLAENSVLTRSIPCVIWDKATNDKWRFVINTYPQSAGIYSRRDVPFEIEDWDTIIFTDNNLLYKIDSSYWELPKKPKKLDRSVSHMISWQNLEYEAGNPIEFFVLPPKPEFKSIQKDEGAVTFYLAGDDSYSMAVISENGNTYQELFKEVGADTFAGDKVSGSLEIGVFTNSVYQGKVKTSYKIDKRPPVNPEITSNVSGFYSRENITAHVQGVPDSELYVAVSNPLKITGTTETLTESNPIFSQVAADNFKLMDSSSVEISLASYKDGAVYYVVKAYSKSGDNISAVSEYKVLIDQYNYYFDSNSQSDVCDGTAQNPYKTFDQCIAEINKSNSVCLKVKGDLVVPAGRHLLTANCTVINDGGASIVFEGDSCLTVKNASLELNKIRVIGKKGKSNNITPLFKLESSVLTLNDCEAGIESGKNGTFIDAYKSVVNVADSIVSVTAVTYASVISAVKSRLFVKNSTINAVAETCVLLSANEGELTVFNNSLKVSGKAGRIAELFGAEGVFEMNNFNAQLTNKAKLSPVYTDKEAVISQKNNQSYGF